MSIASSLCLLFYHDSDPVPYPLLPFLFPKRLIQESCMYLSEHLTGPSSTRTALVTLQSWQQAAMSYSCTPNTSKQPRQPYRHDSRTSRGSHASAKLGRACASLTIIVTHHIQTHSQLTEVFMFSTGDLSVARRCPVYITCLCQVLHSPLQNNDTSLVRRKQSL